jgi:hypothetical protein
MEQFCEVLDACRASTNPQIIGSHPPPLVICSSQMHAYFGAVLLLFRYSTVLFDRRGL